MVRVRVVHNFQKKKTNRGWLEREVDFLDKYMKTFSKFGNF